MTTYTLTFLRALGVFAALAFGATLGATAGSSEYNRTEIVDKHNELRRGVDPPASNMLEMSWSDETEAKAQTWANTCSMIHSARVIDPSRCGENLYMSEDEISWSNAIQEWYDQVNHWSYGVGSTDGQAVGYYTQIVSATSNKVGCAVAHCPNSKYKYFYVCQYCPGGELQSSLPYDKGHSCDDCPKTCNDRLCTNPCPYTDKDRNCAQMKKHCSDRKVAYLCPATCKCKVWFA